MRSERILQCQHSGSASGVTVTVVPASSGAKADSAGVLAYNALAAPAPLLRFVVSPPNLILSWPTNAVGVVLNVASEIAPPTAWTPVTAGISVSGTNYTISVNASSGAGFYTLIAP